MGIYLRLRPCCDCLVFGAAWIVCKVHDGAVVTSTMLRAFSKMAQKIQPAASCGLAEGLREATELPRCGGVLNLLAVLLLSFVELPGAAEPKGKAPIDQPRRLSKSQSLTITLQ